MENCASAREGRATDAVRQTDVHGLHLDPGIVHLKPLDHFFDCFVRAARWRPRRDERSERRLIWTVASITAPRRRAASNERRLKRHRPPVVRNRVCNLKDCPERFGRVGLVRCLRCVPPPRQRQRSADQRPHAAPGKRRVEVRPAPACMQPHARTRNPQRRASAMRGK